MPAFASLSFKNPMDTGIMPISLDSNTIATSRGAGGGCSQLSFSSKSPQPPLSRPTIPSQWSPLSASITHPDTLPQPLGVQIPPSPLLSAAAAPTSLTPSSASAEATLSPPYLSPPQNVILTINHAQPSTVPSASSSTVPLLRDPVEYFRNEVGPENTNRVDYLVQATQGFIKSANVDRRTFTTVLALWSGSFDKPGSEREPIKRLQRLHRGYAKIEHYFADILYIIYFAHECDLAAQSENRKVGKGKGRRRRSEVLSKTAKALGMVEKAVRAIKGRSKNYMLLFQHGGLGSLLQIGPGVAAL